MRDAERELEDELEELMAVLGESDLESEAEWEAEVAPKARGTRCTPAGTRVGTLVCSDAEHANVENLLQMSVLPATLRNAVESAAAGAVSLITPAAASLDIPNRTAASRVAFCASFGVPPEFVPPWRAGVAGSVKWRDLGELVAIRLRDVAAIVDGGCIQYFCWGGPGHCAECPDNPPTYISCSSFLGKYTICLGQGFWRAWQAGDTVTTDLNLLHEGLHIYFGTTVAHTGRTGNASCYQSFVARMNGLALPRRFTDRCPTGACAPAPPVVLDRFLFDSDKLQALHTPLIHGIAQRVVASWKTTAPVQIIQLTGSADSTGTAPYNLGLGLRRATSVQKALAASIRGLDPAVAGKVTFIPLTVGANVPIAPSNTAAGQARNRRVDVTLLPS